MTLRSRSTVRSGVGALDVLRCPAQRRATPGLVEYETMGMRCAICECRAARALAIYICAWRSRCRAPAARGRPTLAAQKKMFFWRDPRGCPPRRERRIASIRRVARHLRVTSHAPTHRVAAASACCRVATASERDATRDEDVCTVRRASHASIEHLCRVYLGWWQPAQQNLIPRFRIRPRTRFASASRFHTVRGTAPPPRAER